jgi:hypothetical protein
VIFLSDSKTGKKPIYLSAASLAILASLPRIEDNHFVIPGEKPGQPRVDLKRPWAAVSKAAGLKGLRIHDLRHSFASIGAGASLGLPIIGKLLGHTQAATTHRYADDERKQFLPLSFWREPSGALRWLWKAVPAPRPGSQPCLARLWLFARVRKRPTLRRGYFRKASASPRRAAASRPRKPIGRPWLGGGR